MAFAHDFLSVGAHGNSDLGRVDDQKRTAVFPRDDAAGFDRFPIPAQIRAARALLGWRQNDLARAAKVGIATIRRIEVLSGEVSGYASTQLRIQQAFERAGIRFIEADTSEGIGVRLRSVQPKRRKRSP